MLIIYIFNPFQIYFVSKYEYPRKIDTQIRYTYESGMLLGYHLATFRVLSSPTIRDLNIRQRKCIFRDEEKLDVSNIYSFETCRKQCKYAEAIKKCNCFLPGHYKAGTNSVFYLKIKVLKHILNFFKEK